MSNLKISVTGVDFIKSFEGFRATVYKDLVGVSTLGFGFTGNLISGMTSITLAKATTMLETILNNNYGTAINKSLTANNVTLNQNQFDALLSFSFNVGVSGLLNSTLYKNIISGTTSTSIIVSGFKAWSNAG